MSRIVKVKNTLGTAATYVGQEIAAGAYYSIDTLELISWASDDAVFTAVGNGELIVNNGTDVTDDIASGVDGWTWLTGGDDHPAELDGRPVMHTTPRRLGTFTYYTGAGDNQTDETKVGGDSSAANSFIFHLDTNVTTLTKRIKLNTVDNETFMHEGIVQFKDCINDKITFEIVPEVMVDGTDFDILGTNTNFAIDPASGLIIPVTATGNVQITNYILVESPKNEFGIRAAAYWNADFNTTTKLFENVTATAGNGVYNMFTVEFALSRFGNELRLLGSSAIALNSNDSSAYGHNMVIKVKFDKNVDAAEGGSNGRKCFANIAMILHRNKTV